MKTSTICMDEKCAHSREADVKGGPQFPFVVSLFFILPSPSPITLLFFIWSACESVTQAHSR